MRFLRSSEVGGIQITLECREDHLKFELEMLPNLIFQEIVDERYEKQRKPPAQLNVPVMSGRVIVPLQFGIQKALENEVNPVKVPDTGTPLIPQVPLTLQHNEHQQTAADSILDTLKIQNTCLAILYTACGKSYIMMYLISKVSAQRTLILVSSCQLMKQLIDLAESFYPGMVGYIQGKKRPKSHHRIVIGMYQTFQKQTSFDSIGRFSFFIVDEVHTCGTFLANQLFYNISCDYFLGLTATQTRKDGGMTILHKWLGEPSVIIRPKRLSMSCEIIIYQFPWIYTNFCPEKYTEWIDWLQRHEERNHAMLQFITHELICVRKRRNMILFTERVLHAENFAQLLLTHPHVIEQDLTVGLYHGHINESDRAEAIEKDLIVSTVPSLGVGVSIPRINTLVRLLPRKEIAQSLGRCLRKQHLDGVVVVDFCDQLYSQKLHRLKVYREELIFHQFPPKYNFITHA